MGFFEFLAFVDCRTYTLCGNSRNIFFFITIVLSKIVSDLITNLAIFCNHLCLFLLSKFFVEGFGVLRREVHLRVLVFALLDYIFRE